MPHRADFLWDVPTLTVGTEIVEVYPRKGTSFNGPNPGITLQHPPPSLSTGGIGVFDVLEVVYPVGFGAVVEEVRFSPTRPLSLHARRICNIYLATRCAQLDHPMTNQYGVATQR